LSVELNLLTDTLQYYYVLNYLVELIFHYGSVNIFASEFSLYECWNLRLKARTLGHMLIELIISLITVNYTKMAYTIPGV
jgi:hypothetical protein